MARGDDGAHAGETLEDLKRKLQELGLSQEGTMEELLARCGDAGASPADVERGLQAPEEYMMSVKQETGVPQRKRMPEAEGEGPEDKRSRLIAKKEAQDDDDDMGDGATPEGIPLSAQADQMTAAAAAAPGATPEGRAASPAQMPLTPCSEGVGQKGEPELTSPNSDAGGRGGGAQSGAESDYMTAENALWEAAGFDGAPQQGSPRSRVAAETADEGSPAGEEPRLAAVKMAADADSDDDPLFGAKPGSKAAATGQPGSQENFSVGDSVEGLYKDGNWYKVTITEDRGEDTFTVKWADFPDANSDKDCLRTVGELRREGGSNKTGDWQQDEGAKEGGKNWEKKDDWRESWDTNKGGEEKKDDGNWWDENKGTVDKWGSGAEWWKSKEENKGDDEDGWGDEAYYETQAEEDPVDHEPLQFRTWTLDDGWHLWDPNSDEAISATVQVQKIRARSEAGWEKRMRILMKGFGKSEEPLNGAYIQQGIHEGRPFFGHTDSDFLIYCHDKRWLLSEELGATAKHLVWAEPPAPEMEEGKAKVLTPKLPPPGPWIPNIAHVSGRPLASECEEAEAAFPDEKAGQFLTELISQQVCDQRMVVAALQWVEANVMEVATIPPDLSGAVVQLLTEERAALKSVCQRVPGKRMLARAKAPIPLAHVRKAAEQVLVDLTNELFEKLGGADTFGDQSSFQEVIDDVLGHRPYTVRIVTLVHAYEFTHLKNSPYANGDALAVALAKLCRPERAVEMVCRLALWDAIRLANTALASDQSLGQDNLRVGKISALNRIFREWELNPSEEQLSQLHVFDLKVQLKILLLLERDIECYWAVTVSVSKDEEQKRNMLRDFLDFGKLLRRHLGDEGDKNRIDLENESRKTLEIFDLARARKSISDVLKTLKKKYGWSPSIATRVSMSKANWVARLSALLHLAHADDVIDADVKLRVLMLQEESKALGTEILDRFEQWHMVGSADGKAVHMPKVIGRERTQQLEDLYLNYEQPRMHMPNTPGNIGQMGIPGTPMIPGATPGGWRGPVSGTPGGMPPGTPGFFGGSRTPAGAPPATPFGGRMMMPATPAGPPPMTPGMPGMYGMAASRTPAGPPPASPGGHTGSHTPGGFMPMTPGANFGFASAVPMTPAAAFGGDRRAPQTPVNAMQMAGAVPQTPGGYHPGMGGMAAAATPGMVPSTPGTVPFRPFAGIPSSMTPGGAVPMTPAAGGCAAPQTPAGASMPFTPGLQHVGTSQPFTPAAPGGCFAQPFTPAPGGCGGAPFTPAGPGLGSVPFTPMPGGCGAPFTPAGPASQPFTPMPGMGNTTPREDGHGGSK